MRITTLTPDLREEYNRFLAKHPTALFYSSWNYKEFLKELIGCEAAYLVAAEGSAIKGVLPLMFMEANGGRVYNSLPYFGSNGGVIADGERAEKELIFAYNEIASSPTTISSTVITNPFLPGHMDGVVHNHLDHRIGQATSLATEGHDAWDEMMARIDPTARRNVKKALREGITVERDHTQMDALRRMHQDNIGAIGGIPKTDRFFDLIPQHFAPGKDFDVFVAKRDGGAIAALLVFYFSQTVEYFTPAIDVEYRPLQPLALIIMTAMAEAARRGFLWWNWGGTWLTQTSLYRFKKKWAPRESRYSYYTQLNHDSLLDWPRERIANTFPNFFVVPFAALRGQGSRG
jgi:hypothetical protein